MCTSYIKYLCILVIHCFEIEIDCLNRTKTYIRHDWLFVVPKIYSHLVLVNNKRKLKYVEDMDDTNTLINIKLIVRMFCACFQLF